MISATLRGIFSSACIDRIVDRNPMDYIRKPAATPAQVKRPLTHEERKRIEATCDSHPDGAYLAAMYYLGVRPGEARGLQWGDFDWDSGLVYIQRDIDYKAGGTAGALKTSKSYRYVPIPAPLRVVLWACRGNPDAFLFSDRTNSRPIAKTVAERLWVELMDACDMTTPVKVGDRKYRNDDIRSRRAALITPHSLRHNYITRCWESGIDVYTTMQLVGHTSIKTTMDIYTHLSNAQMEHAMKQVEEMFSGKKVARKLHKATKTDLTKQENPQNLNSFKGFRGDPSETRTPDTLIKSQVLCQLS